MAHKRSSKLNERKKRGTSKDNKERGWGITERIGRETDEKRACI